MAVSMTEVTHREQNYFSLPPSVHSQKKKKKKKMLHPKWMLFPSCCWGAFRSLAPRCATQPGVSSVLLRSCLLREWESMIGFWQEHHSAVYGRITHCKKCRHRSAHVSIYHRPGGFSWNLCRSSYVGFLAFKGADKQLTWLSGENSYFLLLNLWWFI